MAIGVTVAGFCAASAYVLVDLRQDTRDRAVTGEVNLLSALSQDVARNVELYDMSLQAVVEGLADPGLVGLSPRVQDLMLFDRSARASDLGGMLVLDRDGKVVRGSEPGYLGADLSDREYFKAQRAEPDRGLHVSAPFRRRVTGTDEVVALSRAIRTADGAFAGVVVGTLRLDYLRRMFAKADLGRLGSVNLFLLDGTCVMRVPYDPATIGRDFSDSPNFRRFASAPSGTFDGRATVDGVQRIYSFARVGDLPLVLAVAMAEDEVFATWRVKTTVIGLALLALCAATLVLARLRVRSETEYRVLADNALDVVVRLDPSLRRTYVSPSCRTMLGCDQGELLGRSPQESVHQDDWAAAARLFRDALASQEPREGVFRMRHADGRWLWVEVRCNAVPGGLGYLSVLRDVSARRAAEDRARALNAELERLAHSDGLTGLANRRRFDEGLEAAWSHHVRRGAPVSLLLLDVDRFKAFNDRYGHQEGDACLRNVARAVRAAVAASGTLVARYGGEEIAVVLPGIGRDAAVAEAVRVRDAVRALALPHAGNEPCGSVVTVSVGCATAEDDTFGSPAALVATADTRLYEAKRTGRDRVVATVADAVATAPSPIEAGRLATMAGYGPVEGTGASVELDRVARLAARVFGMPVAFVSLVGRDVATLVGRHGTEARTVSRVDAFCSETILGDEPFMLSDATADPRFSGSSLTRQGVRFYAGAPLIDPCDGHRLGAVCVVDTSPRPALDDGERSVLVGLARLAMDVLTRHRADTGHDGGEGERRSAAA